MSKFCPNCGEELADTAKFCKSCGGTVPDKAYTEDNYVENHKTAIIIGYVCAFIFPLIGLIVSIYLFTRKNSSKASKHGKYILAITLVVWFLSAISIFR